MIKKLIVFFLLLIGAYIVGQREGEMKCQLSMSQTIKEKRQETQIKIKGIKEKTNEEANTNTTDDIRKFLRENYTIGE